MKFVSVAALALALASSQAYAQQITGSAVVTCTAPTKNTDGSNLTNLASYRWYWGNSASSLPNTKTTPAASGCNTIIAALAPGTWFFAATAIDANGVESAKSNVAQKDIPATVPGAPTNLSVVVTITVAGAGAP